MRELPVRRLLLVLALLPLTAAALLTTPHGGVTPMIWPAAGIAVGVTLISPLRRDRILLQAALALVVGGALVLHGSTWTQALVVALVGVVEVWVTVAMLHRGAPDRSPALLDSGDVSRMIGATTVGSGFAALMIAALAVADPTLGSPWLVGVAVLATHAGSLMVLLPLFMPTPEFSALADRREQVTQWCITLGTTVLVFLSADVPPLVFAVMPMFAWLAFRGTVREASVLLVLVAVVTVALTAAQTGPVWGLGDRYDLAPELATGLLQLFLVDCGLILLPISVTVAQQRASAAEVATGRETLERLVASTTGTAIIATDECGRITLFNPGAEETLGYRAADVVGCLPDLFLPQDERLAKSADLGCGTSFRELGRAVAASPNPSRLWTVVRQDGERRTVMMTVSPVADGAGRVRGHVVTAEDVTERERAQAALLLALQHRETAVTRLEELDQIKSDFVSTVSHELRTPITNIVGWTELLKDGMMGPLDPRQGDVVERVDRNSKRLLTLIDDLLTLSRVESADLVLEPVACDLREVATAAYDGIAGSLRTRSLQVLLDLPETPVGYHGDPVQLERMVVNLLSNAVKFTPDGGVVCLVLRVQPDSSVLLEVSDTGVGVPEAEQAKLFTRFFRSSTATARAVQGTGLGLSIVEGIVALHGGSIDFHSTVGKGSTVAVGLPPVAAGSGRPCRADLEGVA